MVKREAAADELRSILRARTTGIRDRWRAWSANLMCPGRLSVALLASLWDEVLDFDPVLAGYIASPIAVPDHAVIVAGSGKETFKTFNVSTAASVLAASTGVTVIKGVSHSVSAVSGAADVLDALGIPAVTNPVAVTGAVEAEGIGFISYAAFCPSYAGRYDGVFPVLSPFSFFMPVAVLAVHASRFLYGLAHRDVHLAAATLRAVRPELDTGFAVATEISADEIMDEWITVGTAYTAIVRDGGIEISRRAPDGPGPGWRHAVAHRSHHTANARAVTDALSPTGHPARAGLVEHNAALIVRAAYDGQIAAADALARVREARHSGRAQRLLGRLQRRKDTPRSCTVS